MEKSEKSLGPFLRKLRYQPTNQLSNQPTNQPTNYYKQHRSYGTSLTPVQKNMFIFATYICDLNFWRKYCKISITKLRESYVFLCKVYPLFFEKFIEYIACLNAHNLLVFVLLLFWSKFCVANSLGYSLSL